MRKLIILENKDMGLNLDKIYNDFKKAFKNIGKLTKGKITSEKIMENFIIEDDNDKKE